MGVAIWGQIPRKLIGLDELAGQTIAFDAFNTRTTMATSRVIWMCQRGLVYATASRVVASADGALLAGVAVRTSIGIDGGDG